MAVKCKSLAQWRAKALAKGSPTDAVLAARTHSELGRLIFLQYVFQSGAGDVISADLSSADKYVPEDLQEYLSQ